MQKRISNMLNFFIKRIKLVVVCGVILLVALLFFKNKTSTLSGKKIESAEIKSGTLEEKLTISGTIDAQEKATLRFQTSGRLSWVGVKEGDFVKKYQAIASLDQREIEKNIQKNLNAYLSERSDFDQANKDDLRDKVMTDAIKRTLSKAQLDLNDSVLDLEIKKLSKEFSNLWTPIEGIVTKVGAAFAGMNITPTLGEFEIINPNTVYFSANADQTEVTKLSTGASGELVLDSYPDTGIQGKIDKISFVPKTGETGTVYSVKFVFDDDNSAYRYRMGMGGDLTFITNKKSGVFYVPVKYVKTENSKKYVKVKRNNREEKVFVETGLETDNEIEIKGEVKTGETVYD